MITKAQLKDMRSLADQPLDEMMASPRERFGVLKGNLGSALDEIERLRKADAAAKGLRKHLQSLTGAVLKALNELDVLMKQPSTEARGRAVAKVQNALEMANDSARYFGLGVDYRKDRKQGGSR